MFDKYLKSIIEDEQTRMYVATAVIIYLMCFTNLIPNQMKSMLKQPLLKVSALAGIAYLSTKNFEGALMLTIIFFATVTCSNSNLESFNLLEKSIVEGSDPEQIKYDLNEMNAAISTSKNEDTPAYSVLNQGVYGGDVKKDLINIAEPADTNAGREFNGRCYRAAVSVAALGEATDEAASELADGNIGGALNVMVGKVFGEKFDPDNKVIEGFDITKPRCGPNLLEIDKCSLELKEDVSNKDSEKLAYPEKPGEAFKACAAAYAKREINVCQFTDANGKCLDADGGDIVENCDDPNSSLCIAPKLAKAVPIDSTTGPFESISIDSIKNSYLLNIPDRTRAKVNSDGEIVKKLGTNQKKDVNGNLLYKVVNAEGTRFDTPSVLPGAFLNVPVRKLNSSFEYSYDWDDKDADEESIVLINIKNITSGEVKNINKIDVSEDATYFLPGNVKIKNAEDKFVDNEGNSTDADGNDLTEDAAADKMHPKFQNPVMESEVVYETEDLYSYVYPFDAGVSLGQYSYKPSDVITYQNAASSYSSGKLKWENSTARKIMKTIGCHRLRDPVTQQYGYWKETKTIDGEVVEGKCIYEAIDQTNNSDSEQTSN